MSVSGVTERREFGTDLDRALVAFGANYRWPDYRRTVHVVADALSELFGPVVAVHIPPSAQYVAVRMSGLDNAVMDASVGFVAVYPAACRAATARGIDLPARIQGLLPNWVEINGEARDGRSYPDAPEGFTVWHPINGRHAGPGTRQETPASWVCTGCFMHMPSSLDACDLCGADRPS
jgi:hypothetical protein